MTNNSQEEQLDGMPATASEDDPGRDDPGNSDAPEEPGDKGRAAVEFLTGLLERMDLEAGVASVREDERVEVELEGVDAGRVIGKKGQTLDALQFLVNKVVNRFPEDRKHVILDVQGYKGRRDESLVSMAQRLAEKATRTGKVISINPMPARERRVIHVALADDPDVTTRSEGEGNERRVRIVPSSRRRADPRR